MKCSSELFMKINQLHRGHIIGLGTFLYLPLALFMPKSVAPLFIFVVVFSLAIHLVKFREFPVISWQFGLVFGLAIVWSGASVFWSIIPSESISLFWPLSATFAGGLVLVSIASSLNNQEFLYLERCIFWGFSIGIVLLIIEVFTTAAISRFLQDLVLNRKVEIYYRSFNSYKTGATVAALAIWPFLALVWKKWGMIWASIILITALALFFISQSNSAFLASAIGLATCSLFFIFGRNLLKAFAIILWVVIISAPYLADMLPDTRTLSRVAPNLPDSVFPRILIWKSAANIIFEAPIIGKGLDSARAISRNTDSIWFYGNKGDRRLSARIPLHPHNSILQIWIELGAIGAIALGFIFMLTFRAIARAEPRRIWSTTSIGTLFTMLMISCTSYGIWQSWWQGVIWLTVANLAAGIRAGIKNHEVDEPRTS